MWNGEYLYNSYEQYGWSKGGQNSLMKELCEQSFPLKFSDEITTGNAQWLNKNLLACPDPTS
jgi:hypothetical protein